MRNAQCARANIGLLVRPFVSCCCWCMLSGLRTIWSVKNARIQFIKRNHEIDREVEMQRPAGRCLLFVQSEFLFAPVHWSSSWPIEAPNCNADCPLLKLDWVRSTVDWKQFGSTVCGITVNFYGNLSNFQHTLCSTSKNKRLFFTKDLNSWRERMLCE